MRRTETLMEDEKKKCDVAIIGAGPYGLSLAAHLKAAGVDFRIFGSPMEFWLQHMPKGMHLTPYVDRMDLIGVTTHTVEHTLVSGMLLVACEISAASGKRPSAASSSHSGMRLASGQPLRHSGSGH